MIPSSVSGSEIQFQQESINKRLRGITTQLLSKPLDRVLGVILVVEILNKSFSSESAFQDILDIGLMYLFTLY